MSELERIIEKYLRKDGTAIAYYNISEDLINKIISNIGKYERPDMLSIFDDKILGIEHFEFDSSNSSSKGSEFKKKDYFTKNKINDKINIGLKDKDSIIVNEQIDSSSSLDNYFNNFIRNFNNHYEKIDEYIKHINEDFGYDKEIEILFFIEDVSPLGSYFIGKNGNVNLLNPLYSDDIINLLKECPKVKYIIIGVYAMKNYKLIIIENNIEILERFVRERQSISNKDFMSFKPQTMGYAFKIPKENNN